MYKCCHYTGISKFDTIPCKISIRYQAVTILDLEKINLARLACLVLNTTAFTIGLRN